MSAPEFPRRIIIPRDDVARGLPRESPRDNRYGRGRGRSVLIEGLSGINYAPRRRRRRRRDNSAGQLGMTRESKRSFSEVSEWERRVQTDTMVNKFRVDRARAENYRGQESTEAPCEPRVRGAVGKFQNTSRHRSTRGNADVKTKARFILEVFKKYHRGMYVP